MKQDSKTVMSNTVDKHTPGPWVYRQSRGNNAYEYKVVIPGGRTICEMEANDLEDIKTVIANAALIASAPQLKKENEELFEMVRQLKNCINRLSQDGLTQHERDTEAQWEGEAHELLARINPNYYRNANQ